MNYDSLAVSLPLLPLQAALGFAAGIVAGFLYFGALWWSVQALAHGRFMPALASHAVRFALLAAVLYGLAKFGVAALLAGALGMLVARSVLIRRARRLP